MQSIHTTVFYHGNCPDGATAALAAWLKLGDEGVRYIPKLYDDAVVEDCTGQAVYILDFSFPISTMRRLDGECAELNLLDHHETALEHLNGFKCRCGQIKLDMSKSGAMLAWEHFHPAAKAPALVAHIEDRDLWKFAHANTKEFLAAVDMAGYGNFRDLHQYLNLTESEYLALVSKGAHYLEKFNKMAQNIADSALPISLLGHESFVVNCPIEFVSDVGNLLARKTGSMGVCFYVKGDSVKVSLRGVNDFNTRAIAEHYGGGGHKLASAFIIRLDQLSDLLNGNLI